MARPGPCLALVALACATLPAAAQQPVMGDGFYNIVGDPDVAQQQVYGTARGWEVVSGQTASGDFAFCAAVQTGPALTWTFGQDAGGQWQLALLSEFSGPTDTVLFSIDGQSSGITGWGDGLWTVFWLNLPEYEAIAQGNTLDIRQGGAGYRIPLSGTGAAALKVQECVQNRGLARTGAAAPRSYDWLNFRPGDLGSHMVVAGTMPDGSPVFVCGAYHAGGFHPGMTGIWSELCSIGYRGQELRFETFQTLRGAGRWQRFTGAVPADAVEGGYEADGRKLYICRVDQGGAVLSGKFRPGFGGCNVPDGGREREVNPFDLLTF